VSHDAPIRCRSAGRRELPGAALGGFSRLELFNGWRDFQFHGLRALVSVWGLLVNEPSFFQFRASILGIELVNSS
jgi:hypothetical protein